MACLISDVTVLLCEICHTRGWRSKTRAAVALVEQREITKNTFSTSILTRVRYG